MTWIDRFPHLKDFYTKVKFGGRCGYGKVPGIIVVDFGLAWTDKTGESPIGSNLDEPVENTVRILRCARSMKPRPPIIFTIMSYNSAFTDASVPLIRKQPSLREVCVEGGRWDNLDPRLKRQADEPLIRKKSTSCFWGTSLAEMLVSRNVDTLIITGCTTECCIRATAQDSASSGFNTIVPFDAVGSRDPECASYGLLDIDLEYGDVVSTEEVLDYLKGLRGK